MADRPKLLMSEKVTDALIAAGILTEAHRISRIVIDLQPGMLPVLHVRRFADERLSEVVGSLEGAQVVIERPPAEVWAVVVGNYEPAEVLALYDNEAAARAHVAAGENLDAVKWATREAYAPSSVSS